MTLSRRYFMTGLTTTAITPLWAQTTAQAPFPNRVIRIVPFGTAGGPIDVVARVYAEKLQQKINIFRKITRTKKQIFLAMVSANGIKKTMYSVEMVDGGKVNLDDFFKQLSF